MIKACAGIPGRSLIAVGGNAAIVLEHPSHMHEVPGHERRVALGEVVINPIGSVVTI